MIGYVLAIAGVGGLLLYAGGSSSSSSNAAANAVTSPQQTAAYNAAMAFDNAANSLGLTQAQANQAYAAGVNATQLATYAQQQGWSTSGGGGTTPAPTTQGPVRVGQAAGVDLLDYGEEDAQTGEPIYRCSASGNPVIIDAQGNPWVWAEE
jgi:hypothetical protein